MSCMETSASHIGITCLTAEMGQNLALDNAGKGFPISFYNHTAVKVDDSVICSAVEGGVHLSCHYTPREVLLSLRRPRSVILRVQPSDAVDQTMKALAHHMDSGDFIKDGGNEWYRNTQCRVREMDSQRLSYLGMGICGGEEWAMKRRLLLMPGGSRQAQDNVEGIICRVADDEEGGSGNFVKMVHDWIEYGHIILIDEAHDLLKSVLGLSNAEVAEVFTEWNKGELQSFLMETRANIVDVKDDYGNEQLVDQMLDKLEKKKIRNLMVYQMLDDSMPKSEQVIDSTLILRYMNMLMDMGKSKAKMKKGVGSDDKKRLVEDVRQALYASMICSYAKGMNMLALKNAEMGWGLDLGKVARIWKEGGCITTGVLDRIERAYERNPGMLDFVEDPEVFDDLCNAPKRGY